MVKGMVSQTPGSFLGKVAVVDVQLDLDCDVHSSQYTAVVIIDVPAVEIGKPVCNEVC